MIEDFEGIGFHTFSPSVLKVAQEIIRINQNYYPEMLRKMFLINVPSVFYMFWKGIQLWLEARSVAKMEMINGNALCVYDKFAAIFDLSTLPQRLGGTSLRDIPKGGSIGTPIKKLKDKAKHKIDIYRGCKHEVTYHFDVGDIVSWEFITKEYDIGFTIECVGGKKTQVKPYERIDSFKMVIKGSLVIEMSGDYLFEWDNSFSWTRGKRLKYNLYKGNELL